MSFWIALSLLTLLTIYLIKHPKKEDPVEQPPPRVKITVTKKEGSLVSKLPPTPPESTGKGVHVSEEELEKWLKGNPDLRKRLDL